ncbi:MAG: hypothetical protein LLG04_10390 [Parachlamydia sp.]|nr:hypothetical protein [Parachlamydia sp.]
MSFYIRDLYTFFEQLVQHPDDRAALKLLQNDYRAPSALVIQSLGQILTACQTRPSFSSDRATQVLLGKIKNNLNAFEQASYPPLLTRITSFVMRQQNPLVIPCSQTKEIVERSLAAISQSRMEVENWFSSGEAKESNKVRAFVDALVEDPKKLSLFIRCSLSYMHWSLMHEKILSECYEQLARFAAERKIPEKHARALAYEVKHSHLEHLTHFNCIVENETFKVDKILFAIKCGPDTLNRFLLSPEEMQMPPEISRQAFQQVMDYFETGCLPDVTSAAAMQPFVEALDYLGVSAADFLLAASRKYRACMRLDRLPGDQYAVFFKDPVDHEVLALLGMRPCCWHIKEVDLSQCKVNDELLQSLANSLPHISLLKLPCPNQLSSSGWGQLSNMDRLARVELQTERNEIQDLMQTLSAGDARHFQYTLKTILTPSREQLEAAKQLANLDRVIHTSDSDLDNLKQLPQLTSLYLNTYLPENDNVTDALLLGLAGSFPQLTCLELLNRKQISNEGLQAFIRLVPQLTEIDLSGTLVSDASIELLVRTCRKLRSLKLNDCRQLTDKALEALAKCGSLQILEIGNCPRLTSQGVNSLTKGAAFSLRELTLPPQLAEGDLLEQIASANPHLAKFRASSAKNLKDEDILHLAENCRELVEINLPDGKRLTNEAIKVLADRCPWLAHVALHNCPQITTEYLRELLEKCPNMRQLWLRECSRLDDDSASSLASQFPHVTIYKRAQTDSMSKAMDEPRNLY